MREAEKEKRYRYSSEGSRLEDAEERGRDHVPGPSPQGKPGQRNGSRDLGLSPFHRALSLAQAFKGSNIEGTERLAHETMHEIVKGL